MKHLYALCSALLLAACGTTAPPGHRFERPPPVSTNPSPVIAHPLARTTTYACEDLTTVVLTEGVPDARATLNSGLEMSLARLRFGTGHYGAPPYEFRALGAEGMWITQGRAVRCRVR
jgi:hypothetical protein